MLRTATSLMALVLLGGLTLAAEQSALWLDVPFVKQQANGCGAAVISMVMQYWHLHQPDQPIAPGAAEIQRALYSADARGIYASDLEQYLRQHHFRTFAIHGEWADLQQHLAKGRPLIVALQSGPGDLHYVVVTGMLPQTGIILKNDPAERKLLKQRRSEFEKEWKAADNWALLAVPNQTGLALR